MTHRRSILAASVALAALGATDATAHAANYEPINAKGFKLVKHGFGKVSYGRVAAVARRNKPVSVATVVNDANRKTRSLSGAHAVRGVAGVAGGFRWTSGDDKVSYWTPQGITGSADASSNGIVGGHHVLLASWYSSNGGGVRVSFVNTDRLASARYRHVLLVTPRSDGGYGRVQVHAGGIAWYGHFLYVADTHHGMRVFDTNRMMLVPKSGRATSGNYKYILPQVGHYESTGKKLTYSYVAIDRAGNAPRILAGEYRNKKAGGRLVTWYINSRTGLLSKARAAYGVRSPRSNMQGALQVNGRYFTSESHGGAHGILAYGRPIDPVRTRTWGYHPEDLTYSPQTNRLYTLTEGRGDRVVFGIGL
jgi:hypothetical protein